MTDAPSPTSPIDIGELRRLHAAAPEPPLSIDVSGGEEFYSAFYQAAPALLDAAEERDRLRADNDRLAADNYVLCEKAPRRLAEIEQLRTDRDALQQRLAARSEMPGQRVSDQVLIKLIEQLGSPGLSTPINALHDLRDLRRWANDQQATPPVGPPCVETRPDGSEIYQEGDPSWLSKELSDVATPPDQQSDGEGDAASEAADIVEMVRDGCNGPCQLSTEEAVENVKVCLALYGRTAVTKPAGVRDEALKSLKEWAGNNCDYEHVEGVFKAIQYLEELAHG